MKNNVGWTKSSTKCHVKFRQPQVWSDAIDIQVDKQTTTTWSTLLSIAKAVVQGIKDQGYDKISLNVPQPNKLFRKFTNLEVNN